jgi:hypothetical protein
MICVHGKQCSFLGHISIFLIIPRSKHTLPNRSLPGGSGGALPPQTTRRLHPCPLAITATPVDSDSGTLRVNDDGWDDEGSSGDGGTPMRARGGSTFRLGPKVLDTSQTYL